VKLERQHSAAAAQPFDEPETWNEQREIKSAAPLRKIEEGGNSIVTFRLFCSSFAGNAGKDQYATLRAWEPFALSGRSDFRS
jgi:hypothetical protein